MGTLAACDASSGPLGADAGAGGSSTNGSGGAAHGATGGAAGGTGGRSSGGTAGQSHGGGTTSGDGGGTTSSDGGGTTSSDAGNPSHPDAAADGSTDGGGDTGPTPAGTSTGPADTTTIGASGGTFASSDGVVTLTFPPGALATDTAVSIERLTNTAPDGLDFAYDLLAGGPGATFSAPVQITFSFTDDDLAAAGGTLDALELGYHDPQGYWHFIADEARDAAAKTVTVSTLHFTPWTLRRSRARIINVPPPPLPLHYMIKGNLNYRNILVCGIATADVLDGFVVTVIRSPSGTYTLARGGITNLPTHLLNLAVSPSYPPGSKVEYGKNPEAYTATSVMATESQGPRVVTVSIEGTSDVGACTATVSGAGAMSFPGIPAVNPYVGVDFDPTLVPSTGTLDTPIPPPSNDWSFSISKF